MALQLQNISDDSTGTKLEDIDISAYTGSCQFISKIMPCSISTILHNRYCIDEKYLNNHLVNDVPYVAFRSNLPRDHWAFKIHAVAKKIQQCIEKKYLKEINLTIHHKETQDVIDQFSFKLRYIPGVDGSFKRGKTATQIASNFFQRINQIPNKNNLNSDQIELQIEWQFYNNIPNSELHYNFKTIPNTTTCEYMSLASLQTRFHKLGVMIALNKQSQQVVQTPDDNLPQSSAGPSSQPPKKLQSKRSSKSLEDDFDTFLSDDDNWTQEKPISMKLQTKKK